MEAIEALEKQAIADAYKLYAESILLVARAGYASVVGGMLAATCLTQHAAKLEGSVGGTRITGHVTKNSKGGSMPLLGVLPLQEVDPETGDVIVQRSFVTQRVSYGVPSKPENVEVAVTADTAALANALAFSSLKRFTMRVSATRWASDEPHIAEYLRDNELEDIDVAALHAAKHSARISSIAPGEYRRRIQGAKINTKTLKGRIG